jgi:hypothetical protein
MQRLQLNPDEKITRKEYLKRKKKQAKNLKKRSKITYVMFVMLALLSIYVFIQFYVYSLSNNFKYVEGDNISNQTVYNVYYVTEGYTYDPVYSLGSIHSDGFNEQTVYQNSEMYSLQINDNYIFGIKNDGIYRINKETKEMEMLVESGVKKYTLKGNRIYYICGDNQVLKYINLDTKEIKDLAMLDISEVLVDDTNIYVVKADKTKKVLLKYDLEGQNEQSLTGNSNVSYIIQDATKIYFVNKADSNRLYSIKKDGTDEAKIDDISSIYDSGDIKEIDGSKYMFVNGNELYYINVEDGNTLWKINLDNKEKAKVISVAIEILQNVDKTVFYKVRNEMGAYLYNYETNFMSQVTKRKIKEFSVDINAKVQVVKDKNLNKN